MERYRIARNDRMNLPVFHFRPRLIDALEALQPRALRRRALCRTDGRDRRVTARDGIRDRVGREARGGHIHRDHRGFIISALGGSRMQIGGGNARVLPTGLGAENLVADLATAIALAEEVVATPAASNSVHY